MSGIRPVVNKPGFYLVPSETEADRLYEVHGSTGACDCRDYLWRRARTYDICKHGKRLRRYLEALAACPACGGRGNFPARYSGYASGSDPIPCVTCNGSGKRQSADPRLLAVADAFRLKEATR